MLKCIIPLQCSSRYLNVLWQFLPTLTNAPIRADDKHHHASMWVFLVMHSPVLVANISFGIMDKKFNTGLIRKIYPHALLRLDVCFPKGFKCISFALSFLVTTLLTRRLHTLLLHVVHDQSTPGIPAAPDQSFHQFWRDIQLYFPPCWLLCLLYSTV